MVLEKDQKLPEKQIQSEPAFEEIEDPVKFSSPNQVHDFQQNVLDVAPKKEITPSTKKKIQLSFENISIAALPKKKRCGNKG